MSAQTENFVREGHTQQNLCASPEVTAAEQEILQVVVNARKQSGLTQKELSARTGIAQSDISKLEQGNANPSIRTLQRLAAGMGMRIRLEFLSEQPSSVSK